MGSKAERILELLKVGKSVAEIAEKAGVSKPYVYSLKNQGKKKRAEKRAMKSVAKGEPLPRRGRPANPEARLKRIEKYALALARELAKAA